MDYNKTFSKNNGTIYSRFIILLVSLILFLRPYGELIPNVINWGSVPRILSIFLLLITIVLILAKKHKIYLPSESRFLVFYFGLVFISLMWAPKFSMINFFGLIFPIVFCIAVFNLSKYLNINFNISIWMYIISISILSVFAIFSPATMNGNRITPVEGYTTIYIAYYGSTGISGILSIYNKEYETKKILLIILGVILGISIILTQTLNAILTFILSLCLYHIINYKLVMYKLIKFKINYKILILFLILLFLVITATIYIQFQDLSLIKLLKIRFQRINNYFMYRFGDINKMTSNRYNIWRNTFEVIREGNLFNLLLGRGMGSYENFYKKNYLIKSTPHSTYIFILFESGIIGLLLFLLFLVNLYKIVINSNNKLLLIVFLYMLFVSIGNDMIFYNHYWLCWLFIRLNL